MKIFLTGVTGFLGSHVAEALCAKGHDVAALARDPSAIHPDIAPLLTAAPPSGRLVLMRGSLSNSASLRAGCAGADAVVHVAGLIQARRESDYRAVNAEGTRTVLDAALAGAPGLCRFVLISSQAAGGPAIDGRPRTGEDEARPVSAYGRTKREGEEIALARAGEVPLTILRPPVVFGARDRMLGRFFRAVARGRVVVWGDGSNAFNVVHAPDVAHAVVLALTTPHASGSILYTAHDLSLTWRTFIAALAAVTGSKVAVTPLPPLVFSLAAALSTAGAFLTRGTPAFSWDKIAELREKAWLCNSGRTREVLGWEPAQAVEQALAATHEWYRRAGQL
jgi:nucleoside-diphosphate-sugar epimerase